MLMPKWILSWSFGNDGLCDLFESIS